MEDLAGPGPRGQQRVVAQHPGVGVGSAALGGPVDLADRGVDVDDQHVVAGTGARGPRPFDSSPHHGFELADMTERERPQERAQRGRGQHPVTQHPPGRARSETVAPINRVGLVDHGVHQGHHLRPGVRGAGPPTQTHELLDERLETQPGGHRRDQQQAR